MVMSRFISVHDTYKHLAPSDEALKQLQYVDLSSFNDSFSDQESYTAIEVLSDSDDPFDPDDLVGIMNSPVQMKKEVGNVALECSTPSRTYLGTSLMPLLPQKVNTVKSEIIDLTQAWNREEIKPEPSTALPVTSNLVNLVNSRTAWTLLDRLTPDSPVKPPHVNPNQHVIKSPMPPPKQNASQSLFVPMLLSPSSSPTREFKRPKVTGSVAIRELHTRVPLKDEIDVARLAVDTKRSSLLNPTIQLATQKPLMSEDHDALLNPEQKVVRPIILSAEQEHVLQLALQGKSIFFTGSAGTGKSVLLKAIIKQLKGKFDPGSVSVTASTGLAACNIGGTTVHSFSGIGLGKGDLKDLLKVVRKNRKAVNRWNGTRVLIIDEISMIDGQLLDKLDWIARKIRKKQHLPFGGIQLIICGDFYQLPPVSKAKIHPDGSEEREDMAFAFESDTWQTALHSKIVLQEVFRQKGDQKFVDMLNEMRMGYVSGETEREFLRLSRPLHCPTGIVPTELYATRFEVERANNFKLSNLTGSAQVYEARDGGSLPPLAKSQMLGNFLAPQKLFLKEKAQVMCIKNFDSQLVNGSLGQVVKFVDRDTYMCEMVMAENPNISLEQLKKELAKRQVKVKLAKANPDADEETLERMSQSAMERVNASDSLEFLLTPEYLYSDASKDKPLLDHVFEFFNEAKTEKSSSTSSASAEDCKDDSDVSHEAKLKDQAFTDNAARKLEFLKKLEQSSNGQKYPLVRFLNPDGVTTRDVVVEPEVWEINDEHTGEVLVSRVQLPLMLAWALSIHKSQGQTLQMVKIDLSRIFENGQAYVALSRAVSRDGLQVINFRKERVRAHLDVIKFYNTLKAVHKADDDEVY